LNFERIFKRVLLYEKLIPLNTNSIKKLDKEIINKLSDLNTQKEWHNSGEVGDSDNALRILRKWIREKDKVYLIVSNDEPVGIIECEIGHFVDKNIVEKLRLKTNRIEHIQEIGLIGFRPNNITVVKDCFSLIDLLLEKFPIITWSVFRDAPVKKIYDRIIHNYNGIIIDLYYESTVRYVITQKRSIYT